jgi:hypothetical protein
MNAYFRTDGAGVVTVRMRAESDDGETIGDLVQDIRVGDDFAGVSYDDLVARGAGAIAFDETGAATIVTTGASA